MLRMSVVRKQPIGESDLPSVLSSEDKGSAIYSQDMIEQIVRTQKK